MDILLEPTDPIGNSVERRYRTEASTSEPPPKKSAQEMFQSAIFDQDLKGVDEALKKGADINVPLTEERSAYNFSYENALFRAINFKDNEMVTLLINKGIDINKTKKNGETCLWSIAENGLEEMADTFINSERFLESAEYYERSLTQFETTAKNSPHLGSTKIFYKLRQKLQEHRGPWSKVDYDTIAHTQYAGNGDIEIVEHFNFLAAERTRFVRDFTLMSLSTEACFFADMPINAQEKIQRAWGELKKHGGNHNEKWKNNTRHYRRR